MSTRTAPILVQGQGIAYNVVSTPAVPQGSYVINAHVTAVAYGDWIRCWIGGVGSDTSTDNFGQSNDVDVITINDIVNTSGAGHRIAIECSDANGGGGVEPVYLEQAQITAIPVGSFASTTN